MANQDIFVSPVIFESEVTSIAGSGDITSLAIPLNSFKPAGNLGLQINTVGAGSIVQLEYLLSNDGITFVTPSDADDIITAHSAGDDLLPIPCAVAKYMKIKATETAGNPASSIALILSVN